MMGDMLREVCLMSIICSTACNLSPDGAVKRIMGICCSVILMLIVLRPLGDFNAEQYAGFIAKYRELETQLNADAQNIQSRLNRLVIEEEYKTYIMDKAKESDIEILGIDIELEWDTNGFWVPKAVSIISYEAGEKLSDFSYILVAELGISEDRIIWLRQNY